MTPEEFQQKLCQGIVARMKSQALPMRSKTRDKAALEMMCGACLALEVVQSDQLNPMLFLTTMVSARGAEVVESVAATGEII